MTVLRTFSEEKDMGITTIRNDLQKYMTDINRKKVVMPLGEVPEEKMPVGWKPRERFGIQMRYWPKLSMLVDDDAQTKAARGIPRMYMRYFIDQIEPKDKSQASVMNLMNIMYSVRSNPLLSLVVMGGNGSGKTLLGCALVNTLNRLSSTIVRATGEMEPDWNPYFCNEADLFNRVEGYSRDGMDWFTEYTENSKFLVIDEFGMTQWTPTDKRRMEQVLNKRFGNGLKTVILTNLSAGRFSELISDQLKSRFRMGRSVTMDSPDYRERFQEEEPTGPNPLDDDYEPF